MAVTQNLILKFGARETFAIDGGGNQSISYTEFDRPATVYKSDSTPQITAAVTDKLSMSGGAATIDLTAAPAAPGSTAAQDLTGLSVITLILYNPNTNDITISPGASNPYPLFGASNDFVLPALCRAAFDFHDELAAISSSVCEIDIAGTGTDQLYYALTAGDLTP